MEKNDWKIT